MIEETDACFIVRDATGRRSLTSIARRSLDGGRRRTCSPVTRPGGSPPTSSSCWELVQRLDFDFEQHFADQVLGSDRRSYLCSESRRSRPSVNIVEDPLTADELFYVYP